MPPVLSYAIKIDTAPFIFFRNEFTPELPFFVQMGSHIIIKVKYIFLPFNEIEYAYMIIDCIE